MHVVKITNFVFAMYIVRPACTLIPRPSLTALSSMQSLITYSSKDLENALVFLALS